MAAAIPGGRLSRHAACSPSWDDEQDGKVNSTSAGNSNSSPARKACRGFPPPTCWLRARARQARTTGPHPELAQLGPDFGRGIGLDLRRLVDRLQQAVLPTCHHGQRKLPDKLILLAASAIRQLQRGEGQPRSEE